MIKRKQLVGFMVGLLMVLSASWQISLAGTVVASDKPLKAVQEVNSIVSSDAVTSTVPFTDVTDQIDSSTLQTATTVPLLIRPWNGNWEQPGAFKITNPNPKTVRLHWVLDCETPWDSQGICRDSAGDVTLEPYHSLAKGFGLICANWRLDIQWDEGGSWGGSVTAPDSCGNPSPASCLLYAVNPLASRRTSQFYTLALRTGVVEPLGSLQPRYDFSGLAIHPKTNLVYATSGPYADLPGKLYLVDGSTGSLEPIGFTGFDNIRGLSFRNSDITLWGWANGQGLVSLDLTSGVGTLVFANTVQMDALAWNTQGTLLYLAQQQVLWVYNPNDGTVTKLANNLPKRTTALDVRPDGLLMGTVSATADLRQQALETITDADMIEANEAVDATNVLPKASFGIFYYNLDALQLVSEKPFADRNGIDEFGWPPTCGNASPGGEANMIKEIIIDNETVCPGEDVHVSVRAEHPENSQDTVDVSINGQWGSSQYLHFTDDPGPRLIQITASTPEKFTDSRQVTITVTACSQAFPLLYTQPNPYHDLTVDFQVANTATLQLQNPVYVWDFGDGQTTTTAVPFVSHFYGDSLKRDQLYTVFQASLTIQQVGQPDRAAHTTLSVWSTYTFNKRLGFIQPRIISSGKAVVTNALLTADYTIKNLESEPIQLTSRWFEYQLCDAEQPPIFSTPETITLQIEGQQEVAQHFEVPLESVSRDVCGLVIHLSGQGAAEVKAYVSVYFEIKDNPFATSSMTDPARLETLNQIIEQGLLGDVDVVTDEDLYRLRKEGKITEQSASITSAAAGEQQNPQVPASVLDGAIGEICKKGELPPRIGISCQVTKEWTYTTAYIANAQKGDIILDPGCDSTIGELLTNVSPPQRFSHSGIVTRDRYEIRHATALKDRYSDYGVTEGFFPFLTYYIRGDILKYGWPGTITQPVYKAYEGEYISDPESGKPYLISGFNKDSKRCPNIGLVNPLVVKPLPEFEATARPKLREVADIALGINGHYRFFVYSNGALAIDPNFVAPEEAGWAAGTVPVVCSDFIWYAMRLAGLTLEGTYLEPKDVALGAERDEATLDGLYLYTAEERRTAGQVLYSRLHNDVYDKAGWFKNFISDAADNVASQVTNCFASDRCDKDAKDSDQWKNTEIGRSVSPDNILFWDASPTGGYGYNEPVAYQPGRYERVYRWQPSEGTGTVTARVYYEGAPAQDATVVFEGFTRVTDVNGTITFDAIPAGTYEIRALKEVAPGAIATAVQDTTVTSGANNTVDLYLGFNPPPQPIATVRVVIEQLHAYGCLGTWMGFLGCWNPEDGLDFYTVTRIDGNELNTIDQTVEGDPTGLDFFPDWDLSSEVDPSRGTIPIEIDIWDEDSGLRGNDDHVDIYPHGGRTLSFSLDLSTCEISGGVAGACGQQLYSEGGGDGHEDLAQIWFHIELIISQNDQAMTTRTSLTPASEAELTTFNRSLWAQFPARSVASPVTLIYQRLQSPSRDLGQGRSAVHSFTLEAKTGDGNAVTQVAQPYTLTLSYTDEQLAKLDIDESSLNVVFWNGNTWVAVLPCSSCSLDTNVNRASVILDHFAEFALVGNTGGDNQGDVYLPLILR